MAYHFRATVTGLAGPQGIVALPGATVNVYQVGTTTPVSFSMFTDAGLSSPATNPLTNTTGIVEFYIGGPVAFDLYITNAGYFPQRITLSTDAQSSWFVSDGNNDFTSDSFQLTPLISTSLPAGTSPPYGGA